MSGNHPSVAASGLRLAILAALGTGAALAAPAASAQSAEDEADLQQLSQELAAVTFKEYALQDANTLEATQTQIGTLAVTEFPLCDQEILLRHLHKTANDYVNDYLKTEKEHANGATR